MSSFDFGAPGFFTTGAVGRPGQRTFFLQAGERGHLATLKVEKAQVAALAEHLATLLDRVATGRAPEDGPGGPADLTLREPVNPAWVVGSIGVAYEEGPDRVVIVLEELREDEEGGDPPEERPGREAGGASGNPGARGREPEAEPAAATARFRLTRGQARAFVGRAREVVKAGRPACPVCGRPMDPEGHVCPRANGRAHLGRPR